MHRTNLVRIRLYCPFPPSPLLSPPPPPVKLPRSTKNDKRGRVAQLPRANIFLRHEIYIQRCALSARSVTRFENHFRFDRFSRAKISKRNENRPCWNTIDRRIGYVEWRISVSVDSSLCFCLLTRSRRKGKRKEIFRDVACRPRASQAANVYVCSWLGLRIWRVKGTGQGFSTLRKKLRVLSFDSVGDRLFPAMLLQGRLTCNSPPLLSPLLHISNNSLVKIDQNCFWNSFQKSLCIEHPNLEQLVIEKRLNIKINRLKFMLRRMEIYVYRFCIHQWMIHRVVNCHAKGGIRHKMLGELHYIRI